MKNWTVHDQLCIILYCVQFCKSDWCVLLFCTAQLLFTINFSKSISKEVNDFTKILSLWWMHLLNYSAYNWVFQVSGLCCTLKPLIILSWIWICSLEYSKLNHHAEVFPTTMVRNQDIRTHDISVFWDGHCIRSVDCGIRKNMSKKL